MASSSRLSDTGPYPVAEELGAAHAHEARLAGPDRWNLLVARGISINVEPQRQLVRSRAVVVDVPR